MKTLAVAAAFTIALTMPAHAYLDPGTGSMVLQAIIGGLAVAGATLSVYWTKVKQLASSVFSRKK